MARLPELRRKLSGHASRVARELVLNRRPQAAIPGHTETLTRNEEVPVRILGLKLGSKLEQRTVEVSSLFGWLITDRTESWEKKVSNLLREEDLRQEFWLAGDGRIMYRSYEDCTHIRDPGRLGAVVNHFIKGDTGARECTPADIELLDRRSWSNRRNYTAEHWCNEWGVGISAALTRLRKSR